MQKYAIRFAFMLFLFAILACSSRTPEKYTGGVPDILVDTITFFGKDTGCVPLYDNVHKTIIAPPEYRWESGTLKPAACLLSKPNSVRVTFRGHPAIKSAKIWAAGGAGGLSSAASPVLIAFTNGKGEGIFRLNNPPDRVGSQEILWHWMYKDAVGKKPGDTSQSPMMAETAGTAPAYNMGTTGPHKLYTVFTDPKEPMTTPWVEVLNYATQWAAGGETEAKVRLKLARNLYESGRFSYIRSSAYNYMIGFQLSDLLTDLHIPGYKPSMNCVDVANFYQVLSSSLGLDDRMTRVTAGDQFDYKPVLPIGLVSCESGTWNYHAVNITTDKKIVDATAKVHCDVLSGGTLTLLEYLNLLSSTYGIGIHPDDLAVSKPY